jgi:hypothetical protein
MAISSLPLANLIRYEDDFDSFYRKREKEIECLSTWQCHLNGQLGSDNFSIWIDSTELIGHLLQRNSENTYFLAEAKDQDGRWHTYFVPDPKDVLQRLYERARDWQKLFPLIRAAHAAAHPEHGREPDLKYLERLMAQALHHFDTNAFISQEIRKAEKRSTSGP